MIDPLRYRSVQDHLIFDEYESSIQCWLCQQERVSTSAFFLCHECGKVDTPRAYCEACFFDYHLTRKRGKEGHKPHPIVRGDPVIVQTLADGNGTTFPKMHDWVTLDYTLTTDDSDTVIEDTFKTKQPLTFQSGCSGPCIHMQLLGCTDIAAADVLGSSDPYCAVYWKNELVGATTVKHMTLDPTWANQTFVLPLAEEFTAAMGSSDGSSVLFSAGALLPKLRIEVYDWDRLSKNDFLGQTSVSDVDILRILRQVRSGAMDEDEALSFNLMPKQSRGKLGIRVALRDEKLFVHVVQAENVPKADPFSLSDPYCEVYWNGTKVGKTLHIEDTLDPVWDLEIFTIKIDAEGPNCLEMSTLRIECLDWDQFGSDDVLGQIELTGLQIKQLAESGDEVEATTEEGGDLAGPDMERIFEFVQTFQKHEKEEGRLGKMVVGVPQDSKVKTSRSEENGGAVAEVAEVDEVVSESSKKKKKQKSKKQTKTKKAVTQAEPEEVKGVPETNSSKDGIPLDILAQDKGALGIDSSGLIEERHTGTEEKGESTGDKLCPGVEQQATVSGGKCVDDVTRTANQGGGNKPEEATQTRASAAPALTGPASAPTPAPALAPAPTPTPTTATAPATAPALPAKGTRLPVDHEQPNVSALPIEGGEKERSGTKMSSNEDKANPGGTKISPDALDASNLNAEANSVVGDQTLPKAGHQGETLVGFASGGKVPVGQGVAVGKTPNIVDGANDEEGRGQGEKTPAEASVQAKNGGKGRNSIVVRYRDASVERLEEDRGILVQYLDDQSAVWIDTKFIPRLQVRDNAPAASNLCRRLWDKRNKVLHLHQRVLNLKRGLKVLLQLAMKGAKMQWYQLELTDEQSGADFVRGSVNCRFLYHTRGSVLRGLDVAVSHMSLGEKARIEVRSDYGFGDVYAAREVPPYATLVFVAEVTAIGRHGARWVLVRRAVKDAVNDTLFRVRSFLLRFASPHSLPGRLLSRWGSLRKSAGTSGPDEVIAEGDTLHGASVQAEAVDEVEAAVTH